MLSDRIMSLNISYHFENSCDHSSEDSFTVSSLSCRIHTYKLTNLFFRDSNFPKLIYQGRQRKNPHHQTEGLSVVDVKCHPNEYDYLLLTTKCLQPYISTSFRTGRVPHVLGVRLYLCVYHYQF